MFHTLRSKLIFSSCAVALLCLMLAAGGTFALAGDYVQRNGFKTLEEKRALAMPLLRVWVSGRRQLGPGRNLILDGLILDAIRSSDLRVLLVDPATSQVVEDTSAKYSAVGQTFRFDVDGTQLEHGLVSQAGVSGTWRFDGESDRIDYVAQRIRTLRLPATDGSATPGNGAGDNGPVFQYVVVFAQPQVRLLTSVFGDLRGVLWPAIMVAILISIVVAFLLARSISRPISKLAGAAAAMARGDYNQRLPVEGRDELSVLTQQFNEMASQVERARKMQRDFVANVSHDLKTPLTSIQGFSQAMLDGAIVDRAGYEQAAGIINDEAQRMSRLVNELLSLTRLESGLMTLELRPIEVGEVVTQLVAAMQPQAQGVGVHLVLRTTGDPSRRILGDIDRLKQAFANLIDNALKHTPEGGYVVLELSDIADGVQVLVRDTGKGIPPEDLPRVMERFYQIDKARSSATRSLGLGLAIAREIVQAHRGQITIESASGQGTAVKVVLPATVPAPEGQQGGVRRLLRGRQPTRPLATTVPMQPSHANGQGDTDVLGAKTGLNGK